MRSRAVGGHPERRLGRVERAGAPPRLAGRGHPGCRRAWFASGGNGRRPEIGLILGSGLDRVVDALEAPLAIPFSEIPGSPVATVPGHPGRLVLGQIAGREVADPRREGALYEGYGADEVAFLVRLLAYLGCRTLVVTNAAGGLNPSFSTGRADADRRPRQPARHGRGRARSAAPRVPRSVRASSRWATPTTLASGELALATAADLGIELREGVYAMVAGPSYETPAEVRFLHAIGADAVGMSTALEVVAARQLGLRVLGLSLITNVAGGAAAQSRGGHRGEPRRPGHGSLGSIVGVIEHAG